MILTDARGLQVYVQVHQYDSPDEFPPNALLINRDMEGAAQGIRLPYSRSEANLLVAGLRRGIAKPSDERTLAIVKHMLERIGNEDKIPLQAW